MSYHSSEQLEHPGHLTPVDQPIGIDRVLLPRLMFASGRTSKAVARIRGIEANPHSVALGLAIGVFAAFVPLFGLQLGLAATGAWFLGANVVAALIGTFIGNPLTWPLMWVASYKVGTVLLGREAATADLASTIDRIGATVVSLSPGTLSETGQLLRPILEALTVGSIPLGLLVAGLAYLIARRLLLGAGAT
ncbi:MAG TPA: DUF2062 domain-containing protein [Hyphomicrobiaceae bacterium]|nr:DUF2062 domain-containing protein [Hyphomicrobiaceae bacterium]